MNDDARRKAALRMFLVRGLGLRAANLLLKHFKTAEAVFDSGTHEVEAFGVPPDVAEDLFSPKSAERAELEWSRAASLGVQIVDIQDAGYPPLLREIFDPPIVLYTRGEKWNAESPQLAIVGTRRPTPYGIQCAERLSEDLAARGLAVVSGLARGIDSAAHRGALRGGGVTYAVFGSGLDFVYPRENRKLAELVEKNGAVISEFPLGTPPSPQNFPIRNRIISGMSLGVVVVEAAEYSGSLITVRLALEANREIFAVPGSITSANSFGPHALIRQGAKLVSGWQDVVEELPHPIRERILVPLIAAMGAGVSSGAQPVLGAVEEKVWKLLSAHEAISIDTLLAKLPLSTSEVYSALLSLETDAHVRQLPGKKYVRRL
jgi:DNA processing protein